MSHTKLRPSFTFTDEKLAELRRIAPEAFADGKVNWDTLKEALGEQLEDEGADAEHFGLNWPGKRDARRMAGSPSKGTLLPQPGKGVNEESTRNVFIEGENLEVLKLLQKAYAGRVKMIYIDPPYNTGNDFVYEDDFTEPLEEYLRRTGQVDEEGRALTTNTRADGRFHSKWLSMMYPRLRLARQLLRDDGVIFVSIDDNEASQLKLIMDEVFGAENYQQQICWKNKYGPGALTKGFGRLHEYILCYSKGSLENVQSVLSEEDMANYNKKDEHYELRGGYITQPLMTNSKDDRPNLVYPVVHDGEEIWPEKQWIWEKERLHRAIDRGEVIFSKARGKWSVRFKQYLKDENGVMRKGKPLSLMLGPFNQEGTQEVRELFGYEAFDFPKPVNLLKRLLGVVVNEDESKDGIYLDFFAGSGTTGQAIDELNAEDGGKRRMILVQLPFALDKANRNRKEGHHTIADVSRERVKRAFKKNKSEAGFLSFGLGKSNYRAWRDVEGADLTALEKAFAEAESPLVPDWSPEGLRTEVMLLEGFPLDSRVEKVTALKKNEVHRIHHEWHAHALLVCLDKKVHADTVKDLQLADGDIFICLDTAIDDQSKLRLSDKGMIKTI